LTITGIKDKNIQTVYLLHHPTATGQQNLKADCNY